MPNTSFFTVRTRHRTEMIDITLEVQKAVTEIGGGNGALVMIFVPHTTAAVTINESADPSVREDIIDVLNRIVPWDLPYRHMEGNSAAHVKSTLVGASEMVAVENGRLVLGTWQGIFFCEFDGPRTRKVRVTLMHDEDMSPSNLQVQGGLDDIN